MGKEDERMITMTFVAVVASRAVDVDVAADALGGDSSSLSSTDAEGAFRRLHKIVKEGASAAERRTRRRRMMLTMMKMNIAK